MSPLAASLSLYNLLTKKTLYNMIKVNGHKPMGPGEMQLLRKLADEVGKPLSMGFEKP